MKQFNTIQLLVCLCLFVGFQTNAQINTPSVSQKAKVSQRVGVSNITIKYSRPSVNGRDVWGSLVPYGMNNLGFGTSTAAPWRAGADENTTITFSHDAKVEGKPIKAGTYGLHIEVKQDNKATLILSYDTDSWGSFFYEQSKDALRADIITTTVPHHELLTYEFNEVLANSATATLAWEKKGFPFTVSFDVTNIVLDDWRQKAKGQPGFQRQNWEQAANFALNNGGDLNEALGWIDNAVAGQFFSQKTFNNLQIKAQILNKLGKADEATAAMDEALQLATIFQVHQYGRTLITNGEADRAFEVFSLNVEKNKDQWPVHYGMARAYSAKGDYKAALKHLRKSLENAPNDASKDRVQANIDKLEKNEDIN
ncbi:DUF2911 domain-containing protein [Psychroserpens jangbogonensis]|uniref:DUF2911 domain-containing protein n=1 Tax=Psychroserpens jangbogonensis TaxID=1484460 RepID=UPI00053E0A83|nr:DUF2911 domain-containing protein [Psychroserpens jangbogonensis]